MDRLEGRVAVVTGAASGIGLGMARAFAAEGMKVVLADVDVDRLADRVARATALIAVCRERIGAARLRIDEVIADLDGLPDVD